jgi:glutamate--cysteine ligase
MQPHPRALGSALTNRYITTDFSEALLEFVTPVYPTTWEALRRLNDIHQFTHKNLDGELLWPSSMPCLLPADDEVPLARYGTSNVGRMKTTYRRGLGYRYGRHMQTISGVHYNYSLPKAFWANYKDALGVKQPDFQSEQYLALVRNFRRFGWLILYLFGASPALCRSFAGKNELDMPTMHGSTYYQPYATSLRMSDLGYSNKNQSRIQISLNSLDQYIKDLTAAMHTPEPDYEKIGVLVDGRYRQLNANRLQIENEYYSAVRPKRVANSGERPTAALRRGGIEYVEIRSLDCNLYDPAGINQDTMRFVEAFLIFCLLEDSPLFDETHLVESASNQKEVARNGRAPDCRLSNQGVDVLLRDWAGEIIRKVTDVAALLDCGDSGNYQSAVREMQHRVSEPERTPSARILEDLNTSKSSFYELALQTARQHHDYWTSMHQSPEEALKDLADEAKASLRRQADIEASDKISFSEYLEAYFAAD